MTAASHLGAAMREAELARDEGMDRATNAADMRVVAIIDALIDACNASGRAWSANDIRDCVSVESKGLVGARVRAASQRRPAVMVCVGRVPSNLPSTHAHEIKLWIGAEHQEGAA